MHDQNHHQTSDEQNNNNSSSTTAPATVENSAYNCNINYTNESICSSPTGSRQNNAHNDNSSGHAIIDVVNTTQAKAAAAVATTNGIAKQLPSPQSAQPKVATTEAHQHNNNNHYSKSSTTTSSSSENTSDAIDVSETTTLGNSATDIESNRKQQKLSNKIVVLLRRSKPIALVVINSLLAVLIATSLCISMGMDYTIPAIVVGLIAIIASSGLWHWLYIAAVTAPRDIRYVKKKKNKRNTQKNKNHN